MNERNGVVLIKLQFNGKELVDPETVPMRGPFVGDHQASTIRS